MVCRQKEQWKSSAERRAVELVRHTAGDTDVFMSAGRSLPKRHDVHLPAPPRSCSRQLSCGVGKPNALTLTHGPCRPAGILGDAGNRSGGGRHGGGRGR